MAGREITFWVNIDGLKAEAFPTRASADVSYAERKYRAYPGAPTNRDACVGIKLLKGGPPGVWSGTVTSFQNWCGAHTDGASAPPGGQIDGKCEAYKPYDFSALIERVEQLEAAAEGKAWDANGLTKRIDVLETAIAPATRFFASQPPDGFGAPPDGYTLLPKGASCRCPDTRSWLFAGNYWCCGGEPMMPHQGSPPDIADTIGLASARNLEKVDVAAAARKQTFKDVTLLLRTVMRNNSENGLTLDATDCVLLTAILDDYFGDRAGKIKGDHPE